MNNARPHQGQPVFTAGAPLAQAKAAMVMIHGRGASPQSILALANEFDTADVAYLAPQASGGTWYPLSFLSPIEANEPGISSGIQAIADVIQQIEDAGIPAEKTMLLGFSQGACLSLEFAARHARRYGAVFGLSGGLIGPEGTPRDYPGSLEGTPVFLGCSDVDSHIPLQRVHDSTEVLRTLGGEVEERIYPGMGHLVNRDEINYVIETMDKVVNS
ncbi:MAG: dienelactone hydrolase family protein [Anaerolineae bacterium]